MYKEIKKKAVSDGTGFCFCFLFLHLTVVFAVIIVHSTQQVPVL